MSKSLIDDMTDRLPEYLDLLRSMVQINSFTSNAAGVNALGNLTAQVFQNLRFTPEFVQSANPKFGRHIFLYGPNWNRVDLPAIALVSHLDTVFPPEEEQLNNFFWRVEGDRAYGPGVIDIKGGTVMIRMVLDAIHKYHPSAFESIRWLVCLDATEETLSDDFGRHCLERMPANSLACLIFEGGTPNPNGFPIVTARKGRAEFLVTSFGRSAHAGNYHKQGANAIVQLSHTVQKIAALTNYQNAITFNVGVIHGGSVVNRVPHSAEAVVEMRAFDPEIFQHGIDAIFALDGSTDIASQDGYPCKIAVALTSQTPPWPQNAETEQLFEIWKKAAAEYGYQTLHEQRGGLSDGNLTWSVIPTLDGLGPSGNNAHCSERSPEGSKEQEFALLTSFVPKAHLNIAGILRLIEHHTKPR